MKPPLISVIVPVYNLNSFLNNCVDSILSQTYKNFELLLINDGSIDGSGETCDEYAKKDDRVRVLHKVNGGVTAARKSGVEIAQGQWITFVDGDDLTPPGALQDLITAVKENINIVIGAYHRIYDDGKYEFFENAYAGVFSNNSYLSIFLNGKVEVAPWGKLFRKHLFYGSIFDLPREIKNKEDLIMNLRLGLNNSGEVLIINKSVYSYRWDRPGSALSVFLKKFNLDYELKIMNYVQEALTETAKDEEFKTELATLYMNFLWGRKKHFFKINTTKYKQLKNMQEFVFKNNRRNLWQLILVFTFMKFGRIVTTLTFPRHNFV
ncbi:glycosyltransferase family 2 protein [Mucilaginibacter calamicampi]|uniref:Glycosyltransferase family 2 protein n=1 Tax=Mucilaginibacter calamicampi TaxID=1302352 RepID=A0ABW2YXG5_9SPHI